MCRPFFVTFSLAVILAGAPAIESVGQDREDKGIEQKIQDALENILNDEVQGGFEDVLNKLSRRIENELTELLDDEQIKGLAKAIENGDVQGLIKHLNVNPNYSVGLQLRKVDADGQPQITVVSVVGGSPAARAGFKEGDVVRSINDRKVESIADLVEVVKRSRGRELKFQLQRDAMAEIIRVKPAMQIAGMPIDPAQAKQMEMLLGALKGEVPNLGDIGKIEKMLGGLFEEFEHPRVPEIQPRPQLKSRPRISIDQLPDNVSLTIKKSGKEPTKITVSRNDQVWEITEAEIDELPAELRPFVRHAVGASLVGGNKQITPTNNKALDDVHQQLKKLRSEMDALEKSLENQR